jgi:glycosyltransferase involved in cell wall biosynthesis
MSRPKILFFNSSLRAGGKERRFVELLAYLKRTGKYELFVVLVKEEIHYKKFFSLEIPFVTIDKSFVKKDLRQFAYYSGLIRKYKPDIVHDWAGVSVFALPAILFLKIPLVSSLINDAKPSQKKYSFSWFKANSVFKFSKVILANSFAGHKAYGFSDKKCKVIYNGVDINRFTSLPSKESMRKKYGIKTTYAVIMVASFSIHKNYNLFIEVANEVCKHRNDITFIGVGGTEAGSERIFVNAKKSATNNPQLVILDQILNIEALINACDIGVLCTYGEGMPNAIIEYMALNKPSIANDLGGVNEIIEDGVNGYLIKSNNAQLFAKKIIYLINNKEELLRMGNAGKSLITSTFSLNRMGNNFERMYDEIHLTVNS